ncbi:riboflavin synthase [Carex littledalei]|uniref:Riboflavin synthase n=1 Tax=Carex littledalei TaxID=544730 RepID=A0A833R057_9POAL|nr:riboflavin synthase [Carex littledalei]
MAALFSASSPALPKTPLRFSSPLKSANFSFQNLQFKPSPRFSRLITSLFTGIVEEIGHIDQVGPTSDDADSGFEMRIGAETVLGGTGLGDSIAINGTCLTVTEIDSAGSRFSVGLSPETLRKTSLGGLGPGSPVNLERALTPETRMGGHFVQGHVDGTGEIIKFSPEGDSLWVTIRTDPDILRLIVPKGFIAVDGTSLTVVGVYEEESSFDLMLVAYTQQKIVLPSKKVGDKVNLEVDILGKYVEKLLSGRLQALGVGPVTSS